MTWTIFLYGMIPLVVFVLVDLFASLRWAVVAAIACAAVDVFLSYYTLKAWDPGSILAFVLLCVLGWVALRRGDERFVKLQPTFLGLGLGLYLGYYQFFGQPLLERYLPAMKEAAPPQYRDLFANPGFLAVLNAALSGAVVVFLVHAALVAVAAYRWSNWTWLIIRGVGFWVLLFVMMFFVFAAHLGELQM